MTINKLTLIAGFGVFMLYKFAVVLLASGKL